MSTKAPHSKRLLFVDTLRGLAVLFMIQLHTSHGWLRPELRQGPAWEVSQFFGGLAAPLFLLLAGAGLGLQWSLPATARSASDTRRTVTRAVGLIILGYVLRLQMWIVDGGAYARIETYPALLLLIMGYAAAYYCHGRLEAHLRPRELGIAGAALLAAWLGLAWAFVYDPSRAAGLVRVDVLQCIGASLIIVGLLGHNTPLRRPAFFYALALAVAFVTPFMQRWVPGPVPAALAGYVAQWPSPAGERVLSLFPLFPWLSFAAAGVAAGLSWGRAAARAQLDTQLVRMTAVAAVIALLANSGWPPLARVALSEELGMLLRVLYKLGLSFALVGIALAFAHGPRALYAPLRALGRASLLVYWVHLEFAFGTVSRPLARALDARSWAWASVALMTAMWALATLRTTRHSLSTPRLRGRPLTG